MDRQPIILIVDKSHSDVELIQDAFLELGLRADFLLAYDGEQALMLLRDGQRRPDFIILELNLPSPDGRELLAWIKSHAELKRIPTVVLTTSSDEADIAACFDLSANGYIVKPPRWEDFVDVIRSLQQFWFSTARLTDSE
ncbi:MAG: response regulator [Planctomycetes bacterium]|nr:response regulator [Planctomycetota bacterium]